MDQDEVRRNAEATGLTEDEARIFLHLNAAVRQWQELPDTDYFETQVILDSYRRMIEKLAVRVVKRDHPEGWLTVDEKEDRDQGREVGF